MKHNSKKQWNRYYFTLTFKSKSHFKPITIISIIAHNKESAYMKLIKRIQFNILDCYDLRSIKLIYVQTNIDINSWNDVRKTSKNALRKYYNTIEQFKFIDCDHQKCCPCYHEETGMCVKYNDKSCDMLHDKYCQDYIDFMKRGVKE